MTNKTIIAGLVIMAFVAGSILTGTMAEAKKGDKGEPFQAILDVIAALQLSVDGIDTSGLATQTSVDDIETDLTALQLSVDDIDTSGLATQSSVDDIETDLLSKKSFYQVEDMVTFVGGPDRNFDILVSLSCPDSVPAEKQAFTIETMGVQVSQNAGNQVAFFNSTVIDQSFGFFYSEAVSTFIGSDLASKHSRGDPHDDSATAIGASEEVRFTGNVVNIDGAEEIIIKVAAIGEKPQGCDVTIDAEAVHLLLPLPFP